MKEIWNRLPIAYKMFSSLLLFVLAAQVFVIVFIWQNEATILLNKEKQNLTIKLSLEAKKLTNHLEMLAKETRFLASLEVMDDMIAKDIDKRISILLQKKAQDLGEEIVFVAMNDKSFIAASQKGFIGKKTHNIKQTLSHKYLYLAAPIHTSFDKTKSIGTLVLLYPLKNLSALGTLQPPTPLPGFSSIPPKNYLIVSQKLDGILANWTIYLSVSKQEALKTLRHIEQILIITFMFAVLMLGAVVWFLSKKMTRPINALLKTSEEIIKTQDYTKQVTIENKDEIGQLATSFNTLIQKTDALLTQKVKHLSMINTTQAALEAKSTFLSIISHELRTPLGSILNLTQHLMLSPRIKEEESALLNRIETSAQHLLAMINNILQLAKLESNTIQAYSAPVNLQQLIQEVCEMVEPLAKEKNLLFQKSIKLTDTTVITDENLLKQVIINLLSNAIKFTHEGSVSLSLTQKKEDFTICVTDTGVGIDKERQKYLFTPFYQTNMQIQDLKSSSGLGLALSQKVAKLIGGKISIQSPGINKGTKSIFIFKSF